MEWLDVVLRSALSLIVLFFLTKMLGKKQVSQLSVFDYVIGISMGSIASEMTVNMEASYIDGITAMTIYALIAFSISILTMKKVRLRHFFTGVPVVLIQKGKISARGLKRSLLDINDLLSECRLAGYFDIAELEYAVMEPGGKISFLPKNYAANTKGADLNVNKPEPTLVGNVIIDGRIMDHNIRNLKRTPEWILKKVREKGYKDIEKIMLATLDSNDNVVIYEKDKHMKIEDVLN